MNRLLGMCCIAVFAAPFVSAQMDDFLDVFMVKVKPDKRADFDMVSRRIAEANRKAKGDTWISTEVVYGEGNTVYFISTRKDYAAVDAGNTAFVSAIKEAYGPGGMKKMESDVNNTIVSSRSEIRRRRWDLSVNPPQDADAYSKLIADARWMRTLRVAVRSGHQADFEELAKRAKAAYEKADPSLVLFVSQTVAGEPGIVYYVTTLQPSFAAFDSIPDLRKAMGEGAFLKWQKEGSETVASSETMFMRILPELSNAPEPVAKAAPQFWRPKPMTAAAKPKPAELAKSAAQ
jgi:hypothetical protein